MTIPHSPERLHPRARTCIRGVRTQCADCSVIGAEACLHCVPQVGTISANGEREIGELIAKAMERVGKEGVITVEVRNSKHYSWLPLSSSQFHDGEPH